MERFLSPLSLDGYSKGYQPVLLGNVGFLDAPERQYVLRMLVSSPYGAHLPNRLRWVEPMLVRSARHQEELGVRHPYVYVTVRSGPVRSVGDDEWHVDGFSMRYTHLPEANYVCVWGTPTQYANQFFDIPLEFDPMRHNLHWLLASQVQSYAIESFRRGALYFVDPYVVHRRPPTTSLTGEWRIFVRITYAPIEIADLHNTKNEGLPTPHYNRDGLDFRRTLTRYE